MGGASAPMLFGRVAAAWDKSVGPEGPPTRASRLAACEWRGCFCGRGFSPDAFRSGRCDSGQRRQA
ncbi:DUF6053 domain-containing protein [Lysobacter enzymogenes]|uniref:DUF6053 domain-containing protein n=1 Tax=Lysobacter enzymogenes TaxID=69 RepID=UPI003D188365